MIRPTLRGQARRYRSTYATPVQTINLSESIAVTLDVSGSLSSSDFSGTVHFETTTPLQGDGSQNLLSGELMITGANGTSISVLVLGDQTVELRIDLDGNGSVDETLTMGWDELG
jgi:hypothetical protein